MAAKRNEMKPKPKPKPSPSPNRKSRYQQRNSCSFIVISKWPQLRYLLNVRQARWTLLSPRTKDACNNDNDAGDCDD